MAGISLRSYVREIEKHVESGRNDEAIAHCLYILKSYPKYIDVYRLLGKAFLESQRYGDAADIFQRVLSSIPDDFVAHVGMSIVREDEGNLDEAIWHMERAFENQPANSAIQDELRRLYGRRDGVEPPKIRLTRGALARMYLKGGLYQQAISEFRAALAENPTRLDLQVLLAETYAKAGQRAEAAEIANAALRKLPYCLTANEIMVATLSGSEREKEARTYLQCLQQLDPYSAFINPNNPTSASVPDQALTLEKVEWKPGQLEGGVEGQPIWATSLGVNLGELSPGIEEPLPEWLSGAPTEEPAETKKEGLQPTVPAFSLDSIEEIPTPAQPSTPVVPPITTTPEEEIPDWMKSVGWDFSTGKVEETKAAIGTEEGEIAAAEIPDWLRAMAPTPGPGESPEKKEEDVSPWLDELFSASKTETAPTQVESGTEIPATQEEVELPDWLSTGIQAVDDKRVPSEEELPPWVFEDQRISTETPPLETEPAAPKEELPEWLLESEAIPSEAISVEGEAAEPANELPEWLDEGEAAISEIPITEAETPLPIQPVEEIPTWLSEEELPTETVTTEEAIPSKAIEEAPAWLSEEELPTETVTAEETIPAETVEELPDWLKAATAETAIEIPDWLLQEETPPTDLKTAEVGEIDKIGPAEEVQLLEEEPLPLSDTKPTRVASTEQISVSPPETIVMPSDEIIPELTTQEPAPLEDIDAAFAWLESLSEDQEVVPLEETRAPIPEPEMPKVEAELTTAPSEDDAAFAWLESLAVKQGAEEALLLKPEERAETPPEWVQQAIEESQLEVKGEEIPLSEKEAELVTPIPEEVAAIETVEIEGIDILSEEPSAVIEEAIPSIPEALTTIPEEEMPVVPEAPSFVLEEELPPTPEEPTTILEEEMPLAPEVLTAILEEEKPLVPEESAAIMEEEISAAPEVPSTIMEEEIPVPPEVLSTITEEEIPITPEAPPVEEEIPSAAEEPTTIAEEEMPLELEKPVPVGLEPYPEVEAEIPEVPETAEAIPELPKWLSETGKGATEELEWQPSIPVLKYELNQVSLAELERLPGVGFITAQRIIEFRETNGPFTAVEDLLKIPDFDPAALEGIREHLHVEISKEIPMTPSEEGISVPVEGELIPELAGARSSLAQGNLEQALKEYADLIRSGQISPGIIQDLEEISGRFPKEIDVWQSLGDAYMRSDQVKKAMDAYIKAEQLLR